MHNNVGGKRLIAALGAALLALPSFGHAAPVQIGSDAEVWLQQMPEEKAAYLEGLCAGLQAGRLLSGELLCSAAPQSASARRGLRAGLRFCAIRFGGRGETTGGKLPTGTQILDAFYRHAAHSDVPVTLAVEYYNDQACGEANVAGRLAEVQTRRKCVRQLVNMRDASKEAQAAQQAVCDKLK